MIPGSNILNMAMGVIGRQSFEYNPFLIRKTNEIGQDVAIYDTPQILSGSVQPVPRSLYQQYGLDLDRYYINFYVSKNVMDVARNVSGDQIVFNGNHYQCLSKTDWSPQDGWVAVLAVQITPAEQTEC
jgi:hypothetical protein